jgi:hypothetical protein
MAETGGDCKAYAPMHKMNRNTKHEKHAIRRAFKIIIGLTPEKLDLNE